MPLSTREKIRKVSGVILAQLEKSGMERCENILLTCWIIQEVSQIFIQVRKEEKDPYDFLKDLEFAKFQENFELYLGSQIITLKNIMGQENLVSKYFDSCKRSMRTINSFYKIGADEYAIQYASMLLVRFFKQKNGTEKMSAGCNAGLIEPDYSIVCDESGRFILSQIYGELKSFG